MNIPQIHILPIKALFSMAFFPANSIAIISSSDPVKIDNFLIPHCSVCYQDLDYESPRSFNAGLAQEIASFVKVNEDIVQHIYVCCQAAQSRSPGIAAALYTHYGLDPLEIFSQPQYHPNMLCFSLLTNALGISVSDAQIDALMYANEKAFKAAIQQSKGIVKQCRCIL